MITKLIQPNRIESEPALAQIWIESWVFWDTILNYDDMKKQLCSNLELHRLPFPVVKSILNWNKEHIYL